jgi:hypothetical protein
MSQIAGSNYRPRAFGKFMTKVRSFRNRVNYSRSLTRPSIRVQHIERKMEAVSGGRFILGRANQLLYREPGQVIDYPTLPGRARLCSPGRRIEFVSWRPAAPPDPGLREPFPARAEASDRQESACRCHEPKRRPPRRPADQTREQPRPEHPGSTPRR